MSMEYEMPTGGNPNLSRAIDQLYSHLVLSVFVVVFFSVSLSIDQGLVELRCRNCLLKELDAHLFNVIQPLIVLDFGENYVNIFDIPTKRRKLYYFAC